MTNDWRLVLVASFRFGISKEEQLHVQDESVSEFIPTSVDRLGSRFHCITFRWGSVAGCWAFHKVHLKDAADDWSRVILKSFIPALHLDHQWTYREKGFFILSAFPPNWNSLILPQAAIECLNVDCHSVREMFLASISAAKAAKAFSELILPSWFNWNFPSMHSIEQQAWAALHFSSQSL